MSTVSIGSSWGRLQTPVRRQKFRTTSGTTHFNELSWHAETRQTHVPRRKITTTHQCGTPDSSLIPPLRSQKSRLMCDGATPYTAITEGIAVKTEQTEATLLPILSFREYRHAPCTSAPEPPRIEKLHQYCSLKETSKGFCGND